MKETTLPGLRRKTLRNAAYLALRVLVDAKQKMKHGEGFGSNYLFIIFIIQKYIWKCLSKSFQPQAKPHKKNKPAN